MQVLAVMSLAGGAAAYMYNSITAPHTPTRTFSECKIQYGRPMSYWYTHRNEWINRCANDFLREVSMSKAPSRGPEEVLRLRADKARMKELYDNCAIAYEIEVLGCTPVSFNDGDGEDEALLVS